MKSELTELCKAILLEQSQFAKLYVQNERKFTAPRSIERGYFGVIKGDTMTYQTPTGTVVTTKITEE